MGKKGFFAKLKDTFIESDEQPKQGVKVEAPTEQTQSAPMPTASVNFSQQAHSSIPEGVLNAPIGANPTTAAPVITAQFQQALYEHLEEAIEVNDLPGVDYFEFKKSFAALKASGLDEITALKSAFASLSANNPDFDLDKLTATADHYIAILNKEDEQFQEELAGQIDTEITTRTSNVTSLEEANQAKLEQIAALQAEIAENNSTIATLQSEIVTEQASIDQTAKNWAFTLNVAIQNIETDKANVAKYLAPAPTTENNG